MCKSDDLISRQAAINAIKRISLGETDAAKLAMRIEDYLIRLSSTQLKQKKGKWEIYTISMLDGEGCKCSECGFEGIPYWNYCSNCGADMRGEKNETD